MDLFISKDKKVQDEPEITEKIAPFGAYYYLTTGNIDYDKALVAWLNSSIGLEFRYRNRAVLGKVSERLLGTQIDNMLYLNVKSLDEDELKLLLNALENIKNYEPLPPVANQIGENYRKNLDLAILKCLKIQEDKFDEILNNIYHNLKTWIKNMKGENNSLIVNSLTHRICNRIKSGDK